MNVQNINLDFDLSKPSAEIVAKQYDRGTRQVHAALLSGGEKAEIAEGTTAELRYTKPDGTGGIFPLEVVDSAVDFELPEQTCLVPGSTVADIALINGDTVIGTASFVIRVKSAGVDLQNIVESTDYYAKLENAITAANAVAEAAERGDFNGAPGERGERGEKGEKGDPGQPGTAGERGERGPAGPAGPAGPQGVQGVQGPQGTAGANGADGFSPSARVDQIDNGARITITDKSGTTQAEVVTQAYDDTEIRQEIEGVEHRLSDIDSINEKINVLLDTVRTQIDLAYGTDGYYGKDGIKVPDVGRKYTIVNVDGNDEYEISTYISSAAIAGLIYRNGDSVIGYDLIGTGTGTSVTDYAITIPEGCDNIIVQAADSRRTISVTKITKVPKHSVSYVTDIDINLGNDILANVNGYYVENTGWSGNKTNGYTHSTGHSASMSFSTNAIEEGAIYICDFDTTFAEGEFVNVGIGSQYRISVYKGESHIQIPLLAVGTKSLYFTPLSNIGFTISNITLRKINGGGDKENLELYNTLTGNHYTNYGFWNVLLGKNTAEGAVGATRTVAIGYAALNALQGGHRNVGVGTFAMSQMEGGENNVSIGADSMLSVKKANDCIAIGKGTMYNGKLVEDNIAIGHYALTGSSSSENSKRNVAIGKNAGWYSYGQGNTYVGYQAGYRCQNTNGNVCIGSNAYGGANGNHNTCVGESTEFSNGVSNSVALGYGVTADKSNQIKLGGSYTTEVVIAGKKIKFNDDGTVTWETL